MPEPILICCTCMSQEYEKRLLAKDHDLKCSQAQLEHVRIELAEAKRIQAEGSHLLPAPEAHEGACCVASLAATFQASGTFINV